MVYHINITIIEILHKLIILHSEKVLNRVFFEVVGQQMHGNNLDPNPIKRNRFENLQLRPARFQTDPVDARRVHRQQQRIQRETLDSRVEIIGVVYETVGVDAVDLHAVSVFLVEGHFFGVGGGTEAGVDRLGFDAIVPAQVEVVLGVRLDQQAVPAVLSFEPFGFGGSAVAVRAGFYVNPVSLEFILEILVEYNDSCTHRRKKRSTYKNGWLYYYSPNSQTP